MLSLIPEVNYYSDILGGQIFISSNVHRLVKNQYIESLKINSEDKLFKGAVTVLGHRP